MNCPDTDCEGFAMATAIEDGESIEVEIVCETCRQRWVTELYIDDFRMDEGDAATLRSEEGGE